jgi:cell division protein FtsI/penicillin-binding protein 2
MNLQGMYFSQRLKRQYPEASLAASILGFVGRNEKNEYVGYYGVEGYYEEELRGLAGIYTGERDLRSHPLFFGFQDRLDRQDGRDLYLTVDAGAQRIVKQKAIEGMRRFGAKEVCIIVAEPHSMAIIALSCLPDYDPNSYKRFLSSHYRNAAIHDVYEPGSTFKPLIVAAALEQGVVNPADLLQENGPVVVGDSQISTWDNQYRGQISVADALAQSSNVGMVRIGEKMGRDAVYAAIKKFGFGEKTGIDLQGEVGGTVRPQDRWYPIDYATVTFGQGIGVTPIQLLSSFASIINGGELLRPYVVAKIGEGEMTQTKNTRMVIRRVISPATSRTMRTLLEYTVANAEYKWKLPPGYRFGGKTGTAQIAIGGRYDVSKTIASFVGFTPVDNPRFVALVILKEPTTSSWGSETAAPLFFDMAKELLTYYNVAPEY